ncbi:MAG: MAC/perforin domain-containing protein [Cyanobacteria bacterium J06554_11]
MPTINFFNHGAYELELTNKKTQEKYAINKGSGVATAIDNISVGDVFDVENKTDPKILYRPVFVGDGVTTIELKGNVPFKDQRLSFSDVKNIDFESNLLGIDLVKFNPRQVVNSFVGKPIFDGLNPSSIDYDYQAGKLVKTGMTFSATNLSKGSKEVKMTSNYSAFSQEWNISLGASATVPVKGVDVTGALDFGANQFEKEERGSSNVYAYTREQKSEYEVSIDPTEAYLDTTFIVDVSRVNSVQDAERQIVSVYGTHYPTKVYYGGERSLYASMSRSTYAKAKGFGIDVKAKLSASKPNVLQKVTQPAAAEGGPSTETSKGSTGSSEIGSGNAGFGYSENQQEKEILSQMKTGYRSIGGSGGFDSWDVDEGNAVAIAVEMEALYNLIEPSVFKDGTSSDVLAQKKSYIKTAVENRLKALKTLGKVIPAPRLYSVTLSRLEVTHEVDDLDKRTRGKVTASVTPDVEGFSGTLWHAPNFDEKNLSYKTGRFVTLNDAKEFVQRPTAEGSFAPLTITIHGDIEERDHLGGAERHTGQAQASINPDLPIGKEQEITFDCKAYTTAAERGTIKVTVKVRRNPSEFDEPLFGFEPISSSNKVSINAGAVTTVPSGQAPVFDPDFYINTYSDLTEAFGYPNPEAARKHWQSYGISEGRRSSPAFDVQYYLSQHADLQQAFGKDYSAVINHWLTYGIGEGRASSLIFDVKYYLGKYADLQAAFGATNYPAAVNHWLSYGVTEGRQGSAAFDPKYYLSANPDVAKAYESTSYKGAMAHYLTYGLKEGRAGAAAATPAPAANPAGSISGSPVFDPNFYIRNYDDLVKAFGYPNDAAAASHWQSHGIKEGRRSSPAFDVQYYLNNHPDLQQAFGADYTAVINHWLTHGIKEGRKSAHVFDVQYYLSKYADLQQAFGADYAAAVNHWLIHGVGEGRQGSAAFDSKYYLSANPDVAKVYGASDYQGAIAHYLEYGFKEGRAGVA